MFPSSAAHRTLSRTAGAGVVATDPDRCDTHVKTKGYLREIKATRVTCAGSRAH